MWTKLSPSKMIPKYPDSIEWFLIGRHVSKAPFTHRRFGIPPYSAEERVNTVFNPQSSVTHPQ